MRFFVFIIALCISQANVAQEFIQQRKSKRISLQSIKEEAGDILAQQLRESAQIIQLLGKVQLACVKSDTQITYEIQRLKDTGTQLCHYSLQLADLLQPMVCTQATYFSNTIGLPELIAELTIIVGVIQEHIISQLNGLLEDTSTVFIKKHASVLPGIVANIKSYEPRLHALRNVLITIENKQHVAKKVEINKQKSLPNGA